MHNLNVLQTIAGFILYFSPQVILGKDRCPDEQGQQYVASSLQLDILPVKIAKKAEKRK